jgi:DNA-binding NarL/FixJ family response regulator
MSVKVLIVDDQSLVRAGFRMILDAEPDIEVVGEAADGLEAVLAARQTEPDVILMDVRMPNVDGLEATRRLLDGRDEGPRILILTTFDLDEYAHAALRAGASGFLLKDALPNDLLSGIRAVASGDAVVAPSVTRRLLDTYAHRLSPDGEGELDPEPYLEALTPREREVLMQVAQALSNSEIAAALHLTEATVKTHVGRILAKLGMRDRVQLVVFAYDIGLVRPSPR